MSAIQFYHDNFLSDATVLGTYGQNDLFPAENIIDPRTTKVFRSVEGVGRAKVFFDLGEIKTPTHCLVRLNPLGPLFPQRYMPLRGGTSYNSGLVANEGSNYSTPYFQINRTQFAGFDIAIQKTYYTPSFRYWSMTPSIGEGKPFFEIPKVFLGVQALGLDNIGIDYGWSLETKSLDKISRNRYGQKFIDKTINQRVLNVGIRLIDKDELDIFMDMFDSIGTHRPVWIVIDPDEVIFNDKERFMLYGYFAGIPKITNNVYAHFDLDLVIEEAI